MGLCVGRLGGKIFNLDLCGAGRFVVVIFFVCLYCRWVLSFLGMGYGVIFFGLGVG